MAQTEEREWLSAQEAAALIGIKTGTLYTWRSNAGRFRGPRSYRVGGRVKYLRSEVEAWMLHDAVPGDDAKT